MTTLNIKDPRVYELAADLAARRGTSMTAVIRSSLEEAMAAELERHRATSLEKLDRMRSALEEIRRSADLDFLSDDALYDPDTGLPW